MKKIIIFITIMIIGTALFACGKQVTTNNKKTESVKPVENEKNTKPSASKEIVTNRAITAPEEAINITEEAITITEEPVVSTEAPRIEPGNTESANNMESYPEYAMTEETVSFDEYFTPYPINEALFSRIRGLSYKENCQISLEDLRYIRALHYNFDGETVEGELIVNKEIAQDVCEIFRELYEVHYPIEKIRLVDEYQADDNLSMADNNSSAFNYRVIDGTNKLSNHAKGFAIDINPLYNPYVRVKNGVQQVLPDNASIYADRTAFNPYYIQKGDICYQIFTSHGFTWGGDWENCKDYQHFEKQ